MKKKMRMSFMAAAVGAGLALPLASLAEVTVENDRFCLRVGDDAVVRSLTLKPGGEEMLEAKEGLPLATVTQDRFFHNEIKLAYPSGEVTCRASRLTREGDVLRVGFELLPYDALIRVRATAAFVDFELAGFEMHGTGYGALKMKTPPVKALRILQLPVRPRANFGAWLNVMWDDRAAVGVFASDPFVKIGAEARQGFRLFSAELDRDLRLEGGKAVLIAANGKDDFLSCLDAMEVAHDLPRGVRDRQNDAFNASVFWTEELTPQTVDRHIAWAKRGGFRMMLVYHKAICHSPLDYYGGEIGDYELRPEYANGLASLREMLAKVKAAGIRPGLHLLHPFVGFASKKYVTPVADHRLHLKKHFTVARDLGTAGGELYVEEDPSSCPLVPETRLLRFEGEILSYEGFTTRRPYRFTGVKRGVKNTRVAALPKGRIGGLLDVAEDGGGACYVDQDSSLQDELCDRFAELWACGFEFLCLDGCEGVNAPCQTHVANGQYRVWQKLTPKPLFTEGAAKAHFAWHHLSGANAFDTFSPELFKAMIVKWPQHEAQMMQCEFSRVSFGWWGIWLPGEKVAGNRRWKAGMTIGTQPDMWEFGTSRAAAWDCPTTIQFRWGATDKFTRHPRIGDLMEVMRRWEDVRAKKWLTPGQKEALKSPTQQHHLYVNARGEYELHPIEMLTGEDAAGLRAFVFTRGERRVIAYWHTSGEGDFTLPLGPDGADVTLHAADLQYFETPLPTMQVRAAFDWYVSDANAGNGHPHGGDAATDYTALAPNAATIGRYESQYEQYKFSDDHTANGSGITLWSKNLASAFDDEPADSSHYWAPYSSGGMVTTLPRIFVSLFMHAKPGAVVSSYDWAIYADDTYTPTYWEMQGSMDGLTWDHLDEQEKVLASGSGTYNGCWSSSVKASDPVKVIKGQKRTGYPIASAPADVVAPQVLNNATVEVAAGAKLVIDGDVTISKLAINAKGAGTIENAKFAANGSLDVQNLPKESSVTLPGTYENVSGFDNVANWGLTVGGKPTTRKLVMKDGKLTVETQGMLIIVN